MSSDDDDVVVQDAPVKQPEDSKLSHLQKLEAWLEDKLGRVRIRIKELLEE